MINNNFTVDDIKINNWFSIFYPDGTNYLGQILVTKDKVNQIENDYLLVVLELKILQTGEKKLFLNRWCNSGTQQEIFNYLSKDEDYTVTLLGDITPDKLNETLEYMEAKIKQNPCLS